MQLGIRPPDIAWQEFTPCTTYLLEILFFPFRRSVHVYETEAGGLGLLAISKNESLKEGSGSVID